MAFKKGHKLAKGGYRSNSGRKPDEFKRKMASLASCAETMEHFRTVLKNKNEDKDIWLKYWTQAAAYGFGKPAQGVELTGKDGEKLTINVVSYGNNRPS